MLQRTLLIAIVLVSVLAQERGLRPSRFHRNPHHHQPSDATQEVFPFRPADVRPGTSDDESSVIEFYDTTEENSTESEDVGTHRKKRGGHFGVLKKWWNWLWGSSSGSRHDRTRDRRHRWEEEERPRQHGHRQQPNACPPPTTITVTKTIFTTVTIGGKVPAEPIAANADNQIRQQNARRQAAFNDWFDQEAVNSATTGAKPLDPSDD